MIENNRPEDDPFELESELKSELTDIRKFGIGDIFSLMTLIALLFAIFVPLFRDLGTTQLVVTAADISVQLVLTFIFFVILRRQRTSMLISSGEKIGLGYTGEIRWTHWPRVKSWLSMILLACVQITLSITFSALLRLDPIRALSNPMFLIYRFQLCYFVAIAATMFFAKKYPGTVEFFANGVCVGGLTLLPPSRYEIRPSQFFRDRIVLVVRTDEHSRVGDTKTVQVDRELQDYLLARLAAER